MLGFLRPRWIDVLLLLGVASLAGLLRLYDRIDVGSPWSNLWPNVTTDLLMIWLAARLIDGLIGERQRRREVALSFRGGLNFTMQRANDLLPEPRGWSIRPLRHEIHWLELRLMRQGHLVVPEERTRVRSAVERLQEIISAAQRLEDLVNREQLLRQDFEERCRQAAESDPDHPWPHEIPTLRRLMREYESYRRDGDVDADASAVVVAAEAAWAPSVTSGLDDQVREALDLHVAVIKEIASVRSNLAEKISAYTEFVRGTEMMILTRFRD